MPQSLFQLEAQIQPTNWPLDGAKGPSLPLGWRFQPAFTYSRSLMGLFLRGGFILTWSGKNTFPIWDRYPWSVPVSPWISAHITELCAGGNGLSTPSQCECLWLWGHLRWEGIQAGLILETLNWNQRVGKSLSDLLLFVILSCLDSSIYFNI